MHKYICVKVEATTIKDDHLLGTIEDVIQDCIYLSREINAKVMIELYGVELLICGDDTVNNKYMEYSIKYDKIPL